MSTVHNPHTTGESADNEHEPDRIGQRTSTTAKASTSPRPARGARLRLVIGAAVVATGLAVAAAALLSGHHARTGGNGTGTTSATSRTSAPWNQAFLQQLSDICQPYAQADQALVFPWPTFDPLHPSINLLPQVATFEQQHYGNDRLLPSLRALQPPPDTKAEWAQLLDLIAQQVRTAQAQITAAASSDLAAFTATADTLHALTPQLDTALHHAGIPESNACTVALED